jgi:hypothetical protein
MSEARLRRSRTRSACGLLRNRRRSMDWRFYSRRPLAFSGLVRLPSANAPRRRARCCYTWLSRRRSERFAFQRRSKASDAGHVPAADFLVFGKALPRPAHSRTPAFPQFQIWVDPAGSFRRGFFRRRFRDRRNAEVGIRYTTDAKPPLGTGEIIGYSSSPVDRPVVGFKPRFRGDDLSAGAGADGP